MMYPQALEFQVNLVFSVTYLANANAYQQINNMQPSNPSKWTVTWWAEIPLGLGYYSTTWTEVGRPPIITELGSFESLIWPIWTIGLSFSRYVCLTLPVSKKSLVHLAGLVKSLASRDFLPCQGLSSIHRRSTGLLFVWLNRSRWLSSCCWSVIIWLIVWFLAFASGASFQSLLVLQQSLSTTCNCGLTIVVVVAPGFVAHIWLTITVLVEALLKRWW